MEPEVDEPQKTPAEEEAEKKFYAKYPSPNSRLN